MGGGYHLIACMEIKPMDDPSHALGCVMGDDDFVLIHAERSGDALSMLGIHSWRIDVHQAAAPLPSYPIHSVEHFVRDRADSSGVQVCGILREHKESTNLIPNSRSVELEAALPRPSRRSKGDVSYHL